MRNLISSFYKDETAATAIEYGLIAAGISVAIIAVVQGLGTKLKSTFTAVQGDNADLMERIAALYFKPGFRIADVTYGKGVFWRNIDTTQYDFHPSDLKTCPTAAFDFRRLPYRSGTFDVVALDPPYVHDPGLLFFEANYRNSETTKGLGHGGRSRGTPGRTTAICGCSRKADRSPSVNLSMTSCSKSLQHPRLQPVGRAKGSS
jgi:Flp pilus assembly pilin Flp